MTREELTPIGPEVESALGDLDIPLADEELNLEPMRDQKLRWTVSWGEVLSADPEKMRLLMANMNEQIKRLYELRTMEMDLERSLTPEEIDLTLHGEKAGESEQASE